MPKFIFEVFDDMQLRRVKIEKVLANESEIPHEVFAALMECAKDEMRSNVSKCLLALVRNHADKIVYRGSLRIEIDPCGLD